MFIKKKTQKPNKMQNKEKTYTQEELRDEVSKAYEHGKVIGENDLLREILFKLLKIKERPELDIYAKE